MIGVRKGIRGLWRGREGEGVRGEGREEREGREGDERGKEDGGLG